MIIKKDIPPPLKLKKGNLYKFQYGSTAKIILLLTNIEKFGSEYLILDWVEVAEKTPPRRNIIHQLMIGDYIKLFSLYIDKTSKEIE